MAEATPMKKQYDQIKQENPDCLLFSVSATFTKCSTRTPKPPRGS